MAHRREEESSCEPEKGKEKSHTVLWLVGKGRQRSRGAELVCKSARDPRAPNVAVQRGVADVAVQREMRGVVRVDAMHVESTTLELHHDDAVAGKARE